MSIGTEIIQEALEEISAHSALKPSNPTSLERGKNVLNGMIARLQDDGVDMGCVPLKEVGSELSEPLGARNGIIQNLAILLHPKFPGSQLSPTLIANARDSLKGMRDDWKIVTIPKKKVNKSFPVGQGNTQSDTWSDPFFIEGTDVG